MVSCLSPGRIRWDQGALGGSNRPACFSARMTACTFDLKAFSSGRFWCLGRGFGRARRHTIGPLQYVKPLAVAMFQAVLFTAWFCISRRRACALWRQLKKKERLPRTCQERSECQKCRSQSLRTSFGASSTAHTLLPCMWLLSGDFMKLSARPRKC